MTMYYRARFEALGKLPEEEAIVEAFERDDRVESCRADIREKTKISFEVPSEVVGGEPSERGPNQSNLDYHGALEPGWGQIFFQTSEEYKTSAVIEIFENATDMLGKPLELLYIDANSEAFSDS
ncbi:MAG: hypothetical protein ABEJ25_02130 [Candidatus Bipolaricaulia bacterium]